MSIGEACSTSSVLPELTSQCWFRRPPRYAVVVIAHRRNSSSGGWLMRWLDIRCQHRTCPASHARPSPPSKSVSWTRHTNAGKDAGDMTDEREASALVAAIRAGDVAVVQKLLDEN